MTEQGSLPPRSPADSDWAMGDEQADPAPQPRRLARARRQGASRRRLLVWGVPLVVAVIVAVVVVVLVRPARARLP